MAVKKVTLKFGRKKREVEVYTCEITDFRAVYFQAQVTGPEVRTKKDADELVREILRKLRA